jgi:hypothetical protein
MNKKRHHYIPIAYLKNFADSKGRITAFLKDDPSKTLCVDPKEIGFEKYYYSQITASGDKDNNTVEDLFCVTESQWPPLVKRMINYESINDKIFDFFTFLALMRMRVPAVRDAYEAISASFIKAQLDIMNEAGELPPPPKGIENLLEYIDVAIDPQHSLYGMKDTASGFATTVDRLGFQIVHLPSNMSIITSDNPIVYYNPDIDESIMRPYVVGLDKGSIELLFPVAPQLLIRGHTDLKFRNRMRGIEHASLADASEIKRINRMISRFSYRFVFAKDNQHRPVFEKYADTSPVFSASRTHKLEGLEVRGSWQFGKRLKKPKW